VPAGSALADQSSCAFMGTVVQNGAGTGVVVATGPRAEFGRIAVGLATSEPETDFQVGLRRFSMLLVKVALALSMLILVINLFLHRPVLESAMFSLSIAIGLTPQLLPAVVSTSLAAGSAELAKRKVLVKRLVAIEDLGDIDVLVTPARARPGPPPPAVSRNRFSIWVRWRYQCSTAAARSLVVTSRLVTMNE
jgi:Mg2+-importing ATPase